MLCRIYIKTYVGLLRHVTYYISKNNSNVATTTYLSKITLIAYLYYSINKLLILVPCNSTPIIDF